MKEKDELMKIKNTKENRSKMNTSAEKRVHAVLLEDILTTILTPTVVLKMDIEGYECKVVL